MAKSVKVCPHCGIAMSGGQQAMDVHIEIKHPSICPVCKRNESTTESTVDVYSNTPIACCESCALLLSEAMRHQFNNTASRLWLHENREYLARAANALRAVYDKAQ